MRKQEEEKMLELAAIRRLKAKPLLEWEKDFIRNVERRSSLTEKQRIWLKRLKEKYLR